MKTIHKLLILLLVIASCKNRPAKTRSEITGQEQINVPVDEVWKQFMKIKAGTTEKMPPDSNCYLILNHKRVSYYRKNKLEFANDLREYLSNDSLIVYRIKDQPLLQIGYNRKDSVLLLTNGHPEGGSPSGDLEFFARKVENKPITPFH